MKKNFSLALQILLMLFLSSNAYAIKAYPHPVVITQPDGSTLSVVLRGDEFKKYKTTVDGYLIRLNSKGFYSYVTNDEHNTEIIARDINKRSATESAFLSKLPKANAQLKITQPATQRMSKMKSASNIQRSFPMTGTPKSLVILVNFSDKSFVTSNSQTAFTNLLNESGYSANSGTGSARDYFMASSYGAFAPQFDVIGPYTLPNNMAYYGANDEDGYDLRPQQLVIDACTLANNAGTDFTQYDTDNDGYVDNIFIYYAGYNEAEWAPENTIWPHRWTLANTSTKFDGKTIYDYACTSELKGETGSTMCGIGTFCHEFGHVLGLPDYYHTDDSEKATVGDWSIMDGGGYSNNGRTPPTYSTYDRFFLGWLTPQEVNTASDLTLLPIYQGTSAPANTNQQSYLLSATTHNLNGANPTPNEFFVLEYRKKTGWDSHLPSEGLLIWHIDYNQSAWDENAPNNYTGSNQTASSHMRVYLQPLSGSSTTPGTAFTTGSFTPTTWSGTNINRAITEITKTSNDISFKLMGGNPDPGITVTGAFSAFAAEKGSSSSAQTISVAGNDLSADIAVGLSNQENFEMKLSTESAWSKSLVISPVSGNVNVSLQVRYVPQSGGTHASQLTLSSTGVESRSVSLSGAATVPYVPGTPYISYGTIQNSILFPSTKINTSKLKSLNIKTTDLVGNLSVSISGANAAMFSVSTATIQKDAANGATGSNITVTYRPTETGTHQATLTIAGGGLNPAKVITLSGEGL